MPGVDFLGAVSVAESPPTLGSLKTGSLKTHKTLPRADIQQRGTFVKSQINQKPKPFPPSQVRDSRRGPQGDRLRSWIYESTDKQSAGKQIIPVAGLQSTPTIDFRDNFKSWIDDKALRDPEFLSQQKIAPGNSPLISDSVPISDTSLVRNPTKLSRTYPFSNTRDVSGGSVGTFPESRTDSFRTARENLSSDDENHSPDSPSLHPTRQKWLRDVALSQPSDVGLGLGLELDDAESLTPKEVGSRMKFNPLDGDFVTFDGMWSQYALRDLDDAEIQTTLRIPGEKSTEQIPDNQERSQPDSPTLGVEIRKSSQKETRGQLRHGKRSRNSTAKNAASGGKRKSPTSQSKNDPLPNHTLNEELQDIQDIQDIQEKRLSQASTSSTVVEAMVIQSSQSHRRPSLRHTGKLLMLDGLQDHHKQLHRTSTDPNDGLSKYSLRASSKNADRRPWESPASQNMSSRMPNPVAPRPNERSNVVVVPDRRSSLQSSTTSSKRLSKTFSLNSKPQSSRPTTAPENAVGYFDIPQRGRTLSVVIQHATPVTKRERDLSPRDHSNGSLAAVAAAKELASTSPATNILQPPDADDRQVIRPDRSGSGDWTALRPTSALITPYSLRSHSSTPGTLEVNEATAISIFPHTAESIVVIKTFGDPSSPKEQSALIAGNASIGLPSDDNPLISRPFMDSTETEIMDSSLQNPRKPPSLPGLKIIPPTPANAASSSEDTVRHVHPSKRSNPFKTPITSLRRAMSARRYSESSIANPFIFSRTLSLRDTTAHRSPRVPEVNRGNQLHPFWRPRTRFNGNSDEDSDSSDFGDYVVSTNQRSKRKRTASGNKQSDTTTPPNPRRTMSLTRRFAESLRPVPRRTSVSMAPEAVLVDSFDEPKTTRNHSSNPRRTQSLTRRMDGLLRLPSIPISRPRRPRRATTADWNNQPNYEFVPVDQRQYLVEESPYQSRNMGFQNLAERIERRRSLREESKREERRQVLKGQIKSIGVKDHNTEKSSSPRRPPRRDLPESEI